MLRLGLTAVGGAIVAQAVPDSPSDVTTLVGQLGAVGLVVAYAYWRQRHADGLLKDRDATIAEMTKTMIESVVPALEKTAAASNEMRTAMERIIEANRRGDYGNDDRRARDR